MQRSDWLPSREDDEVIGLLTSAGCTEVAIFWREVHDGRLRAIRSCDPPEHSWHLSISHWPRGRRRLPRYPTWDEIAHARYELLPDNINVGMFLPPPAEFVSVEDTTFHLHEYREGGGIPPEPAPAGNDGAGAPDQPEPGERVRER